MNHKDLLLDWLAQIEKKGIPQKKLHKLMWDEVIKALRTKLEAGTWKDVEGYITENKKRFEGSQSMMGPVVAQQVFTQVSQKIWSINRKMEKEQRKNV